MYNVYSGHAGLLNRKTQGKNCKFTNILKSYIISMSLTKPLSSSSFFFLFCIFKIYIGLSYGRQDL